MRRRLWIPALCLVVVGGLASLPAAEDGADTLVQTINKVGKEGSGNAEAATAWRALVSRGPSALLPILRGMNDDALVAANWLRPAFEAVAEKALARKALPVADLTKFLQDTKNAGIARRIAYEWIVKADPKSADKFLPGMLKDPSPELRRDAVQRFIDTGDKALKGADKDAAKAAFQTALSGACDPDQVEALAASLKKLGVTVDVQKHFGAVSRWYLAGPFEHSKGSGWDVAYPPEKGVDLQSTYTGKQDAKVAWVPTMTTNEQGVVDVNKSLKPYKGAVCYAYAIVDSPKKQTIEFRSGSIAALKIFVNGKKIFAREEYHHGTNIDQYTARATLNAGKNEVLLKLCQNEQTEPWAQKWTYQLRLCDATGVAIPFTQPVPKEKK